jgi:hypothetical protein
MQSSPLVVGLRTVCCLYRSKANCLPFQSSRYLRVLLSFFLWHHQAKKCNPHLSRSVCSFIYGSKANCLPFQFVTFSYATFVNCILLCNPQHLNSLPCSCVVSAYGAAVQFPSRFLLIVYFYANPHT